MTHRIAIVGAGPSGCYLAQALLKARTDLRVDLIDALPVPYGLVRYGVAPDHQGTKAVTRQFARVFERQGARFFGNVHVGRDVGIDQLAEAYDVVVFAAGLSADRRLGVPGDDAECIVGAGALTRSLNGHPDADPLPDLGKNPLIIGNGNVAIDVLRLLAKQPEELAGSDLGKQPTRWLVESGIETIKIVGRSRATRAKFDPVMIRELGKLVGVRIDVGELGTADKHEPGKKLLEALAAIDGHGNGPCPISFLFSHTPVAVETQNGCAVGLRCRTEDGVEKVIPCTAIITAIGFKASGDLPRDLILKRAEIDNRVYAAGWFQRGPRGTIPENRTDAQPLAARILDDLKRQPDASEKPGGAIIETRGDIIDYQGWLRIDRVETATADETRCRVKIEDRTAMLKTASGAEELCT